MSGAASMTKRFKSESTVGEFLVSTDVAALPNPGMSRIPANLKPLLLLIGIAAAVAAGVMVVLWSKGPNYSLLYANTERRRSGAGCVGSRSFRHQVPARTSIERHLGSIGATQRCASETRRPGLA